MYEKHLPSGPKQVFKEAGPCPEGTLAHLSHFSSSEWQIEQQTTPLHGHTQAKDQQARSYAGSGETLACMFLLPEWVAKGQCRVVPQPHCPRTRSSREQEGS